MKTILNLLLLFLLAKNINGQEVKSRIPPSDEGIREQTEQTGKDIPEIVTERLNFLDSELNAISVEAEESGRETERYLLLVNRYNQLRAKITRDLEEGYETETDIEHNIRMLEVQLQAIRKEVGMAEPGLPEK
jgi:hypothetical protein